MKLEQFIGIFPNVINDDLCSEFVKWFDEISEHNLTMSSMEETGYSGIIRKDELVLIPNTLPSSCFPKDLTTSLWQSLDKCYNLYNKEYDIDQQLTSYEFKIHRVQPSGGYHVWHHEHKFSDPYRILAWHLTLEVPKAGGETEFVHQSIRIEPRVGQLAIWPAGFTHKHRGNPPLEGQKTYLTGWFNLVSPPQ